jgi:hypothetical protein
MENNNAAGSRSDSSPPLGSGRGVTLHAPAEAHAALRQCLGAGLEAPDIEAALGCVTGLVVNLLGDHQAHLKPGALKGEERQFSVSGVFMVSADGSQNVLIAERNFPPEQHRLAVESGHAHPGQVVRTGKSLLLENTDDDISFRQILKTSRMGSAIYAPMMWQGRVLGQLVCGAQARNTYRPLDLEILESFADVATLTWLGFNGPRDLAAILAG